MKFDPARFAAIRSQQVETLVANGLSRLDEITSVPCSVAIPAIHKRLVADARASIAAADAAKKPAVIPVAPPLQAPTPAPAMDLEAMSAEVKKAEEEHAESMILQGFSARQPKQIPTQPRINPAVAQANLALLRSGVALIKPKTEGETS